MSHGGGCFTSKLTRCLLSVVLAVGLLPGLSYASEGSAAEDIAAPQVTTSTGDENAVADEGATSGSGGESSASAAEDEGDPSLDGAGSEGEQGGQMMPEGYAPLAFNLAGSGTDADPYLIGTVDDYKVFVEAVNVTGGDFATASYKLTQDIDLTDIDEGYRTAIGSSSSKAFKGRFDGGDHTISGLAIDKETDYQGLFGYVQNAVIANITVEGSVTGRQKVGGIAGYATGSRIENAVNKANVTTVSYTGGGGVAGVVGSDYNTSLVNCGNEGEISAAYDVSDYYSIGSGYNVLGGVAGYVYSSTSSGVSIDSCYNTGDITSVTRAIGGIVGEARPYNTSAKLIVQNCYNTGGITYTAPDTGNAYANYSGGIVGYFNGYSSYWKVFSLSNCYNVGMVTSAYNRTGKNCAILGGTSSTSGYTLSASTTSNNYYLDGCADHAMVLGSTAYDVEGGIVAKKIDTDFKSAGFAANLGGAFADDNGAAQFNAGWPYLRWQNPNATYLAKISVSLADTNNHDEANPISVSIKDASGADVTSQFTADASNSSAAASWSLDGVRNGTAYTYIVSKKGYDDVAGSIAINKASAESAVSLSSTAYSYALTVSPADASVSFTKDGSALGASGEAVVDKVANTATYTFSGLYNSSTLGYTVDRFAYEKATGAPVISFGNAADSVSLVKNPTHALTFKVSEPTGASTTAKALDISETADVPGSVVSALEAAAADASSNVPVVLAYYRDAASEYDNLVVYDSRADASAPASATDGVFAFTANDLPAGTYGYVAYAKGYPVVQGEATVSDADVEQAVSFSKTASGEAWDGQSVELGWYLFNKDADEFHIGTAAEMAGLSALVGGAAKDYDGKAVAAENFAGKTVYLDADIDLGGANDNPVYFTPIGAWSESGGATSFAGTFDGQGHTISNLLVGSGDTARLHTQSTSTGLFSSIAGSSTERVAVKNLVIDNPSISVDKGATAGASSAGILAGTAKYADISNVSITGADAKLIVASRYGVGGIVGKVPGYSTELTTITDCSNAALIQSDSYHIGGIVGQAGGKALIARCANTGAVKSTATNYSTTLTYGMGGIVGQVSSNGGTVIDTTYNAGAVEGSVASLGGIVGAISGSYVNWTISNSYNTGAVINTSTKGSTSQGIMAGGILGYMSGSYSNSYMNFENCYSAGAVGFGESAYATQNAGGILGGSTSYAVVAKNASNNWFATDVEGAPESAIGKNYRSEGTVEGAMEGKTAADMKAAEFPATLGSVYRADFADAAVNGGFPILRWQDSAAKWSASFTIALDTAANDDFVTSYADGKVSIDQVGTLPVVVVKDAAGAEVAADVAVAFAPTADENGQITHAYTVSYAMDNGDYTYEISKKGYNETLEGEGDDAAYVSSASGSFTVNRSDVANQVDLVATKYPYTLSVVDGASNPLSDATVVVRNGGADGKNVVADTIDLENATRTYNVYNGSYYVKVSQYGYAPRETTEAELVKVSYVGASNEVKLDKLAEHMLTIVASPSEGAFADAQATLSLECADKTFDTVVGEADPATGKVTFATQVAEGTYRYTLRSGGFDRVTGEVVVAADQTVEVTLSKAGGWDGETVDTSWYSKDATEFHIASAAELAGFAQIVNGTAKNDEGLSIVADSFAGKTVYLDANIKLGGFGWTPIGEYGYGGNAFSGTFDGQGHSVEGMFVDASAVTATSGLGFFGNAKNASFKNFTVNGSISGTCPASAMILDVGGVLAYASAGGSVSFENVGSSVAVNVGANGSTVHAGGLVGWTLSQAKFVGCYNKADVEIGGSAGTMFVGGLVGFGSGSNQSGYALAIASSYNTGAVKAATTDTSRKKLAVGGFVGSQNSNPVGISNAYTSGVVSGAADGVAQDNVGATIGANSSAGTSVASSVFYRAGAVDKSAGSLSESATNLASAKTETELKSPAIVGELNTDAAEDAPTFTANNAGGFPLLSWERIVTNVEVVSGPDKTSYNDMDRFDDTGIQLKVTYTSGDPVILDKGWTVLDGASLTPLQKTVTIDYNGWRFPFNIEVTQIEHETIGAIGLEIAGPVLGETPSSEATITSKQDGTYSASVAWTRAGEPVGGTFATGAFYRATVTVATEHEDNVAWYVLPENVKVSVGAADGTPDAYEQLYAERSADGQSYTVVLTYAPLAGAGETPTAYHLYYQGDENASLYNRALDAQSALTLALDGEEETFSLADIEQSALDGTLAAQEETFSTVSDGEFGASVYTGVKLYRFITEHALARLGDDTEVTFVTAAGEKATLTMGDLRVSRNAYDADGAQTGSVPWLLAFGKDASPLIGASNVSAAEGPLMIVGGQTSASEPAFAQNVVRIEVGDVRSQQTRTVSFSATCAGSEVSNLDISVTDGFGNAMPVENNRCSVFAGEDYSFVVKAAGYTTSVGAIAAGEDDVGIALSLTRVYAGSFTDADQPARDDAGTYLIETPEQLMWWATNGAQSDNVKLLADIALNDGTTFDATSNQWPASTFGSKEDAAYRGTFDGNGHTISGFYINRENTIDLWLGWDGSVGMLSDNVSQLGMFGYASRATIKNLGLDGRIDVLGRPDSMYASWMCVGAFVGYGTGVTIENCSANLGVNHVQAQGSGSLGGVPFDGWPQNEDAYIGGIIGTAANSTITNCYSRGELTSSGGRTTSIGGIAGRAHQYSDGQTVIENCYSTAKIVAAPEWGRGTFYSYQGGIVGKCTNPTSTTIPQIKNCVALNPTIDGTDGEWSRAQRVEGTTLANIENSYGSSAMTIENAQVDANAAANGKDVSIAAATARSTYVEGALWAENTDRTVTEASAGWQFPTDSTPLLYWEDASALRTPDQGINVINPGTGDGGDDGAFSEYAPPATFTLSVQIEGHDARPQRVYTSKELLHMATLGKVKFSGLKDTYAAYGRVATESIPFADLIADAGLSFGSGDSLTMGNTSDFDYDTYFGTKRYYYPNWASEQGEDSNPVEVPTSLLIKSYGGTMNYGTDGDTMLDMYATSADYLYAYMIAFGQTSPTEINVPKFSYQQRGATVNYRAADAANGYVEDLLASLIQQATDNANGTAVGTSVPEMNKGTVFVTADVMSAFKTAIEAARVDQRTIAAGTATNGSIMDAVEALESAIAAFDAAKQEGSKGVDFSGLEAAIDMGGDYAGDVARGVIAVSADGTDVPSYRRWVHPGVYTQLITALDEAKSYLNDAYATQEEVDRAEEMLTAILQQFEDDIQTGKTSIAGATVAPIPDQTYTGSAIEPKLSVELDGVALVQDVDFTATFYNNTDAGAATVVIEGAGDYAGVVTASFVIARAGASDPTPSPTPTPGKKIDISTGSIVPISDKDYTGSAIEPAVIVTVGGQVLAAGSDYAVHYTDNVEIGVASVTVIGTGSYTGTLATTFKIVKGSGGSGDISRFTDVDQNAWYAPGITFVVGKGIMQGYAGTNVFGVGEGLTRAELAMMLWRIDQPEAAASYKAQGALNTTGLSDVEGGTWYTGAANWAVRKGVINGKVQPDGSRLFDPNAKATFEELVQIIVNYAASANAVEGTDTGVLSRYVDGSDVSAWAEKAMSWATIVGFVEGYGEPDGHYLIPQETVTRERAAMLFMKAYRDSVL